MSFLKASEHLKKYGLENKIMEFNVSSATVKEAAEAVGCTDAEIAKTLSFVIDGMAILIVTSGDQKIDNSKYKAIFQKKAKMIPFEDVEKMTGHEVGGVCPFGLREDTKVYLDISLKRFDIVYPACGSCNSAVKLSIDELERVSEFCKWIDVCKQIM